MEFSDIALAKFLQTAPELGNLIVTFQDVSDELSEDSDVVVGIYVLKSGDDYFFVPVVSKSDNVYPIDSVFFNSKGKFFPLTKKITELILNSQKLNMGKKTKIPSTVDQNPSVYEMINPPRTGKFVYASKSRLTEFLAVVPNEIKADIRTKLASDMSLCTTLNKTFGLETIFEALQDIPVIKQAEVDTSPRVMTGGTDLLDSEVKDLLDNGYFVKQSNLISRQMTPRLAVRVEDYAKMGKVYTLQNLQAHATYDVIMKTGDTRRVFAPVYKDTLRLAPPKDYDRDGGPNYPRVHGDHTFILFEDSGYALTDNVLAVGEPTDGLEVLRTVFEYNPPVMLKDLDGYSTFAIFSPDMELTGVFRGNGTPVHHGYGVTMKAVCRKTNQPVHIHAYRNFHEQPLTGRGSDIFIPYTALILRLDGDKTFDLEINANQAQKKRSLGELSVMGSSMEIVNDGIEFFVNGRRIGSEVKMAQILIEDEGLEPTVAKNFIKAAKDDKKVKLYLSKKAGSSDFAPGEIPQFGVKPQEPVNNFGPDADRVNSGSLMTNMNAAAKTGDGQIMESTIISELLQCPDLYEYIQEYIPDIEEAIDKLGRILFLARVHINVLAEQNDPDGVFAFLAALKNVYRTLGDTLIKLQQLSNNVPNENK